MTNKEKPKLITAAKLDLVVSPGLLLCIQPHLHILSNIFGEKNKLVMKDDEK